MPKADGTLTSEEFGTAATKLLEVWGGMRSPCRVCGSSQFFIHPALLANRSDTVSTMAPHTRFPTVAVYCGNCGLVDHYSARALGINVLQVGETPADD